MGDPMTPPRRRHGLMVRLRTLRREPPSPPFLVLVPRLVAFPRSPSLLRPRKTLERTLRAANEFTLERRRAGLRPVHFPRCERKKADAA